MRSYKTFSIYFMRELFKAFSIFSFCIYFFRNDYDISISVHFPYHEPLTSNSSKQYVKLCKPKLRPRAFQIWYRTSLVIENIIQNRKSFLTLKNEIIQMIQFFREEILASRNGYIKIVICILKIIKASFPKTFRK